MEELGGVGKSPSQDIDREYGIHYNRKRGKNERREDK